MRTCPCVRAAARDTAPRVSEPLRATLYPADPLSTPNSKRTTVDEDPVEACFKKVRRHAAGSALAAGCALAIHGLERRPPPLHPASAVFLLRCPRSTVGCRPAAFSSL